VKRILVVEDVELNRDLLVQLLEDRYEVLIADDGKMALDLAARERPDLILMDLSLPIIDGWEATRLIKSDPVLRHIPVIAVSAHAMQGDAEIARQCGCDDYLPKPLNDELLLRKVADLLGHG
jgi:two-component system cell cycle response regulator DivK